jgi:ATP-dependent helicase/nuclease subunit B
MERIFLDWSRPALEAVVDYLWQRYQADGVWELGGVVLVLPGARAGRRLNERLAQHAAERQVALFPPVVTTAGQLPELLYPCHRPFAAQLTQQMAWTEALRQSPAGVLGEFLRAIPETSDDPRWWELGTLLWRQHRELAADGLDFQHVAVAGGRLPGFVERARWQALAAVQQAYLRQLDQLGLWDRQTARLFAIEHHECRTDRDLLLVGTVDLNRALRQMLDQIQHRVTALVYAPATWEAGFDEYGCLRPAYWRDVAIPLAEEQIRLAERPVDQAAEVVRFLAQLEGQYAAPEIAVGVPDETLVPLIQRALTAAGVPARYGPGCRVEATRPVRLIRALVQYLTSDELADLADVVRHPDLMAWLSASSGTVAEDIAELDEYCCQRLVLSVRQAVLGDDPASQAAGRLIRQVDRLLAPLAGPPRAPGEWVADLMGIVTSIYGAREIDRDDGADRLVLAGCEALRDGLLELGHLPAALVRPVTAFQAVLMALSVQTHQQVAASPQPDAVELLGWLELPLDDAPVLVVTQLNEGTIPTSANSDLFLPDRLRAHLGLDDNARRYARDAYALTVVAHSRERFAVIVGRRDEQGNPLLPSRLLLAADDAVCRRRCQRLFGGVPLWEAAGGSSADASAAPESTSPAAPPAVEAASHRFCVPRPRPAPPIDTLNVTDFRAYLACPYRFYLTRVLGVQSVLPPPGELDGATFGTLMHEVLARFGESSVRDATDAEQIGSYLLEVLQQVFTARFGPAPRPAVQIQQAQLKLRLLAFAPQQAAWRAQGWRIVMTEGQRQTVTTKWRVDGQPVWLRGRIDRIDQHEESGEYAILDYKSSEEGHSPRAIHLAGTRGGIVEPEHWQDLQLPLYRHLVAELRLEREPRLGFVTLPRALQNTGFQLADWTRQELATADEAACEVVRRLRKGIFWPPADGAKSFDAGLDRICQIDVFDRQLEAERETWVAAGSEQAMAAEEGGRS